MKPWKGSRLDSTKLILKEMSRYNLDTYADIIYRNALLYPEDWAFKYGVRRITFADFNSRVNRLIHALNSMDLKKGEVLGILSWNCLEYVEIYGAAMKAGFIISPFNPRLKPDELEHIINYSQAGVLFVGSELADTADSLQPRLPNVRHYISLERAAMGMTAYSDLAASFSDEEPEVPVEEDDPLFIFYTSGTTGIPRGALYTHGCALDDTKRLALALGLRREDRQIQIMPLFHVGGAKTFWGYFFVGACNVIMPQRSFDPSATLRAVEEEQATDIHIVPTHLASFFALPDLDNYNLMSLKRMFYAASPMPRELLKKGLEKWGPIFVQCYGASEDGPNVMILSKQQHMVLDRPAEEQKVLWSAGFPHIGVHVRIVDDQEEDVAPGEVGEIIVQSRAVMREWWRMPEDTRNTIVNGWVHTGDMGRYDERGYIYIVDRKKDMIISGGENVFPREVEEILYQHGAVLEAAVIGIPDPYWVERVHAVVTLKEDAHATPAELIDFCRERIAGYKVPKSLEFVRWLPKNPAGKILKRRLRKAYWENQEKII